MNVADLRWRVKRALRARLQSPLRALAGLLGIALVAYLAQFWWQYSGYRWRFAHWTHRLVSPTPSAGITGESAYARAFDRCLRVLRADRRVRLIRYDFPLEALRYQQAAGGEAQGFASAGAWRLQSRRALLVGIAVPRVWRGVLDDHGIVFIDPRLAPPEALANSGTPLPLAVLQRDFLLVPDLTGPRRSAYQVMPWRQLSTKR